MLYDTLWRPPYGKSEQSLRGGIPPPNALYIIIIYMLAVLRAAASGPAKATKKALPTFRLAEPSAGGQAVIAFELLRQKVCPKLLSVRTVARSQRRRRCLSKTELYYRHQYCL